MAIVHMILVGAMIGGAVSYFTRSKLTTITKKAKEQRILKGAAIGAVIGLVAFFILGGF